MDGETVIPGSTAGAGTTPAGGTTGTGAGTGDGGAGGGKPASGVGANAGAASGLDRSRLNPMLRGMDEDQLNEVFDTLFSAVKTGSSGVPAHARTEEPPAPTVPTQDELKEMFDPSSEKFNPQAAIEKIVSVNYGGLLGDINARSLSAIEVSIAQQYPDYPDFKKEINTILQGRPVTGISQNDLLGAYIMAKGAKVVQAEMAARKTPPTTRTPSAQTGDENGAPAEKEIKLSGEEERVARIMYRGSADPVAEFKKASKQAANFGAMKVPGDK